MVVYKNPKSWEDQAIQKEREEEMENDAWLTMGAKVLSEVKEWRKAHPKATVVESEDDVHRQMVQVEAQHLQDAAHESSSRAWGKETSREAPSCQVPLQARGQQKRTFLQRFANVLTSVRDEGKGKNSACRERA
jgi:hypothetical protein